MARRKPQVGDLAIHPTLDSREVAEVSGDGGWIRLSFWGRTSENWFPADNYKFKEMPSA